jgi:hypothetical protein
MISNSQHKINTAYNYFISQLVLWNYLNNKVKADTEQGYEVVKNKEKLDKYIDKVLELLPDIDALDRSSIKSYFPLVNDVSLIQYFKDTVQ